MVNLLATPSLSQSITNGTGPKSLVKESAVILCRIVLQICAPVFDQLSDEVALELQMLGSHEDRVPGKSMALSVESACLLKMHLSQPASHAPFTSSESASVGESAPVCDDDVIHIDQKNDLTITDVGMKGLL